MLADTADCRTPSACEAPPASAHAARTAFLTKRSSLPHPLNLTEERGALRRERAILLRERAQALGHAVQASWLRFVLTWHAYNPNQPRVPAGNPDGGQWTDDGGRSGARIIRVSDSEPPGGRDSEPPKIPEERPERPEERYSVAKNVARWLRPLADTAGDQAEASLRIALSAMKLPTWFAHYYPTVRASLDPPKTLEELQEAVKEPRPGYHLHHIVEQTPARQDGFSEALINSPDNLARIPAMKHMAITGWYARRNDEFDRKSPREYLAGKNWDERWRIGILSLILHGVLKP